MGTDGREMSFDDGCGGRCDCCGEVISDELEDVDGVSWWRDVLLSNVSFIRTFLLQNLILYYW